MEYQVQESVAVKPCRVETQRLVPPEEFSHVGPGSRNLAFQQPVELTQNNSLFHFRVDAFEGDVGPIFSVAVDQKLENLAAGDDLRPR